MATTPARGSLAWTRHRPRVLRGARWLLVLVFAWSAGGKVFWASEFRRILCATGMIPAGWTTPLGYGLPALEFLLAAAIALRCLEPLALLLATGLSAVFTGIHAYLLLSGTVVACGCAGVAISFQSAGAHAALLLLSVVMTGASVLLLLAPPTATCPPRTTDIPCQSPTVDTFSK